jgi:hypothetical protein
MRLQACGFWGIAVFSVALGTASGALAVTLDQTDDFQDGTTQGWGSGGANPNPPSWVADGGPLGDGDAFLLVEGNGGPGAGSNLVAFNTDQWAGDYGGAGVGAVQANLRNLGNTSLAVRLLLEGPGGGFFSLAAASLPSDSGWRAICFGVDAASLTGGNDAEATLAAVSKLRIVHAPTPGGVEPIAGALGVDDITAVSADDPLCDVKLLVGIDIKPGSCPNSFNRNSRGVLPVAVVGTQELDATRIDPSSVEICSLDGSGRVRKGCDQSNPDEDCCIGPNEGPPGPHTVVEDVATPFAGELCDCHELEGDGIPDLSLKFKTQDLIPALGLGELGAGELPELLVRGRLLEPFGGTPFEGSDCVRLVPPGTPPNLLALQSNAADAWVDVGPLDDQLDGGGFASFERTYPSATEVTLTASATHEGRTFRGWKADGGRLVPGDTFRIVVDGHIQTLEAVYEAPRRGCGLGLELALLLPPLVWLARRRWRS